MTRPTEFAEKDELTRWGEIEKTRGFGGDSEERGGWNGTEGGVELVEEEKDLVGEDEGETVHGEHLELLCWERRWYPLYGRLCV